MNPNAAAAAPAGATGAGDDGTAAATRAAELQRLLAAVHADPSAFDFYALLRRIDALRPDAPRTGEALRPRQEALRLGQAPELDFAAAPLHALETRGSVPRLLVRFFGLLGPQGPMPLHFTEITRDRQRHHDDPTLAHFLDLFHHRMLALFYRAWAQAQPVVQLDRPHDDRFRAWLGAVAGLPPGSGALPPAALAYHAGWFTSRSRHPEMLRKVLQQHFRVGVRIEEHVGHWLPIEAAERTRLGFARNRFEHALRPAPRLGASANAGSRVWDRQYRFRLRLGPLDHARYLGFLPGGRAWPELLHWVRLLAGREATWDLALDLAEGERPSPRLGRHVRLGLTSWLTRPRRGTPSASGPPAAEAPAAGAPTELAAADGSRSPSVPRPSRVSPGLCLRPHTSFLLHRSGVPDA